jgi:hypothetical protein
MTRPLLLIDVDGVLNPFVPAGAALPEGYAAYHLGGQRVVLSVQHGIWLHELAKHFDLAWVTTWEAEANALVGPIMGAPHDLPFIEFRERSVDGWTWKLPAVRRFAEDRPMAWLDDDPGPDAEAWASSRVAPTILVAPDPSVGWTVAEFEELMAFGRACAS